ncbi:MAG: hypothetical protein ACOYNI_02865 [Acidimicrobiia bacterium]
MSGISVGVARDALHPRPASAATNHQITRFAGGVGTSSSPTAVWGSGNQLARFGNYVYIADSTANVIRRLDVTDASPSNWTMTVVAGNGARATTGDGGPATSASINQPNGVVVDSNGDLFIAETGGARIRRVVTSTGLIYTYVSSGLNNPRHLAVDSSNNLYIANNALYRITKVSYSATTTSYPLTGTNIVGTGSAGSTGDGGASNAAAVGQMYGVAVDSSNNLYIADTQYHVIRRVAAPLDGTGIISTIAGLASTAGSTGDGGASNAARLSSPYGLSIDSSGNLLIADGGNAKIRRIATPLTGSGLISTVAGAGTPTGYSGDGGAATSAKMNAPIGVVAGTGSTFWVSDSSNQVIRYVNASGVISTVAFGGTGVSAGDGGQAAAAQLVGQNTGSTAPSVPIATDNTRGFLYVADFYRVRRVNLSTGVISTYAGTMGSAGTAGDGGAATSATLGNVAGLAVDQTSGDLYIADSGNHRIRKVTFSTGVITKIAGTGGANVTNDGAVSGTSTISSPYQLALTSSGDLLVAETGAHKIRKISAPLDGTGILSTFMGSGTACSGAANSCNSATPTSVNLNAARGVAVAPNGDVYVADSSNHRVRKVSGGVASVVVGTGSASSTGDGGPGYGATTRSPQMLAVDTSGNVFFTENGSGTYRLRKLDTSGTVTTIAGTTTSQVWGDTGPASMASFVSPYGVAIDASTNVYVSDSSAYSVRKIQNVAASGAGVISTAVFGAGSGLSLAGLQYSVNRLTVAGTSAYFLDYSPTGTNAAILRKLDLATNALTVVAGNNVNQASGDGGLATAASLNGLVNHDGGVARDSAGDLYIASGNSIRKVVLSTGLIYTYATLPSSYVNEIAFDSSDNLFVAGPNSNYIWRIPAGTAQMYWPITVGASHVFAGTGTACAASSTCGDGGAATSANVTPYGLAVNTANGDLYFTDNANGNRIRKISGGTVTNFAGSATGATGNAEGTGAAATFNAPKGLAINSGYLYVADQGNHRVRRVLLSSGATSAYAGSGTSGNQGDAGAATAARLSSPSCVTFDSSNNAYICDQSKGASRKVDTTTNCSGGPCISTVIAVNSTSASLGDGGQATSAIPGSGSNRLPTAIDRARNLLYVAGLATIRQVNLTTGVITRYGGATTAGGSSTGDGGQATAAGFNSIQALMVDQSTGDLYVSDGHGVRKITYSSGVVSKVAGTYTAGSTGDNGASSSASVSSPRQLALDANGNLLIADSGNNKVRRVATPLNGNGIITTWAGTGTSCATFAGAAGSSSCESATPTSIALTAPTGLASDATGNVYIGDTANWKVYKVTAAGVASVFAGSGVNGTTGDGLAATSARVGSVSAIATDSGGNVYFGDIGQYNVRRVDSYGVISTVVGVSGNAVTGFFGDGGFATVARTGTPWGLALDASGNLYLGDYTVARIRKVTLPSAEPTLAIVSGALTQGLSATISATVTNNGAASTSGTTTVEVTLPAGLTYTSGTMSGGSCSAAGQVVTCSSSTAVEFNSGTLAASIGVTVGSTATGPVTISGSVTNASDTNTANNTASDVEGITVVNQAPSVTSLANATGSTWTPQVAATISFNTADVDGNLANFIVCVRRATSSCSSSAESVSVARWTVSSSGIAADAGNGTWSLTRTTPASPNWSSTGTTNWSFAVTPGKVARAEAGWVFQVYATDSMSAVSGWQTLGSSFTMATYTELSPLGSTSFGSLAPNAASSAVSRTASGILCNTSCQVKLATLGTWSAGSYSIAARTDGIAPSRAQFSLYCSTSSTPSLSASSAIGTSAAALNGSNALAANTNTSSQSLGFYCGLKNGRTAAATYSGTVSVSLG